jgi:hypothetical protein
VRAGVRMSQRMTAAAMERVSDTLPGVCFSDLNWSIADSTAVVQCSTVPLCIVSSSHGEGE